MNHVHTDTISWLLDHTSKQGATACDAVLFETVDLSASCRMGSPEGLERSESKALGLRAFVGESQAIVSTTDTTKDALIELASRVVAMARAAPADPDSTLAPDELYAKKIPNLDLCDSNEPSVEWLAEQCKIAEDVARAVPGITNSEGADAHFSRSTIHLAIHNGKTLRFAGAYPTSHCSISASVLAGEGTNMQRDYDFSSARHIGDLEAAASIGKNAAERALKRMNPRKVPTCQAPVVFDPRVSKSLVSVFAGAISGSSIARGASFLKDDLGKQVFAKNIRIIDDPLKVRGLGSKPFDGEGVSANKLVLIENGELKSWLLDVRTASKLKMTTTGSASRGVASAPSPSTSNIYMEAGKQNPAALMKDIESGFYVTETFGMGINTVTGDYSQGAAGFWIEKGEIAYSVSEITIAGNLRDMFAGATPANDLEFRYATNAPTLRIERMTIAGT